MNDQLILELGGFCTELLGSEAFKALTQLYSQQCAADILETKPHELKKREQVYASYLGFEAFLALATKFSEAHSALTGEQQPKDTTDDPRVHDIYTDETSDTTDDPRVHDIYGMD
ncbi:MAG: hypothetical protein ACHP7H_00565 [Hyphomicrobiales bacterium]